MKWSEDNMSKYFPGAKLCSAEIPGKLVEKADVKPLPESYWQKIYQNVNRADINRAQTHNLLFVVSKLGKYSNTKGTP